MNRFGRPTRVAPWIIAFTASLVATLPPPVAAAIDEPPATQPEPTQPNPSQPDPTPPDPAVFNPSLPDPALINPEPVQGVPLSFSLTYNPAITNSFTGLVYVMFAAAESHEPRLGPQWFTSNPFFSLDVKDWKPDTPLIIDDKARCFPESMSQVRRKTWSVQAVMRRNPDSPTAGEGEGDAFSAVLRRQIAGATGGQIPLRIDQLVGPDSFRQTDRVKLVELRSSLLSTFRGRDAIMRAAVILPEHYADDSKRLYPALYWIGGFGADHHAASAIARRWDDTGLSDRIIRVVLDPLCYGGHHAFADSENNGPVSRALVEEFIPHLEKTFRLAAKPTGRFLSGHSSGGWAALWLQTAHPDFFGGVWAISPDPVDFRDFQRINLYQPAANMFLDESGQRRPIARRDDAILGWYDDFAKMDYVLGEGGQLRSFEWVFGRRGTDGKPQRLFDRKTGEVDPAVADWWKRYDIRLILQENWATLGPKLAGKLHVIMGELDTFYLEGATRLLKQALAELGSDAVVEIVPGRDHGSVMTGDLRKRIDSELLAVFEKSNAQRAPATQGSQ